MAMARDRLGVARMALESGSTPSAVSLAYYAMLYAARAALSEDDKYAKTHVGTWQLFREAFVAPGAFDADLLGRAQATQREREDADYQARQPTRERAHEIVTLSEQFVRAVEERFP
jgi:uncharacterized protein (UPF0332 family)